MKILNIKIKNTSAYLRLCFVVFFKIMIKMTLNLKKYTIKIYLLISGCLEFLLHR